MRRLVAVVTPAGDTPLDLAMLEDVVDLVSDMAEVQACLAVRSGATPEVRAVTWPGSPVVEVSADPGVVELLVALGNEGADEACVVVPDVPDLPTLLLGKLHSALTGAEVAVCPAVDGRLVAVAARLPLARWLMEADPRLDDQDVLLRLRGDGRRGALHVGAGWRRVRSLDDARALDPGLEGWEATRALLAP